MLATELGTEGSGTVTIDPRLQEWPMSGRGLKDLESTLAGARAVGCGLTVEE